MTTHNSNKYWTLLITIGLIVNAYSDPLFAACLPEPTGAYRVYDSRAQFCEKEGVNGWYFHDQTGKPLPVWDSANGVLRGNSDYPWLQQSADGGVPGENMGIVKQWWSPVQGKATITISGQSVSSSPGKSSCGDGVQLVAWSSIDPSTPFINAPLDTTGALFSQTRTWNIQKGAGFSVFIFPKANNWCDWTKFNMHIEIDTTDPKPSVPVPADPIVDPIVVAPSEPIEAAPLPQAGNVNADNYTLTMLTPTPVESQIEAPSLPNVGAFFEIPPWQIGGGWHQLFITTAHTYQCATPIDLTKSALRLDSRYCSLSSRGDTLGRTPSTISSNTDWRRNYYGVFSSHSMGGRIVSFMHGENKNEKIENNFFQNTINKNVQAEKCFSGYKSGVYEDCSEAYNAFVGMSWVTSNASTGWGAQEFSDEGPVVWPSLGYIDSNGKKTSGGVRHPSSIVSGDFIYLFYLDTSFSGEPGKAWGIKVARAPLASGGQPGSFNSYYAGRFDQSSLPKGFNKNQVSDFFARSGPKADIIFQSTSPMRFSVAAIKGTNLFAGIEETVEDGRWLLRLRTSKNLFQWSAPKNIISIPGNWDEGVIHYPIFLDKSGWSNTEIDFGDFYILGTQPGKKQNPLHIRLSGQWM